MENAAKAAHPLEACGLLLGQGARVEAFIEARNVHQTPQTHFEIDPLALIAVHKAARSGGPKVVGYFHSHPQGPAAPSATDQSMATSDGAIWAIHGQADDGRALRFYRAPSPFGEGGFAELPMSTIES